MKKTCSSLNLGITHSLLFYMAVLVIMPQRAPLYPIVIWLGMIILSGLIVHNYWNKKSSNQLVVRLRKNYKKTQGAALLSALLFLLTCISFKVINYINTIIPSVLVFMTALCIIYTISSHIQSFDNKEKNIAIKVKLGIKYSWLIVSLISYYLARSLISNIFDIPFDTTLNKLMTAVSALLFIFIFYYTIYFICISYLILMAPKIKKEKQHHLMTLAIQCQFSLHYFLLVTFHILHLVYRRFPSSNSVSDLPWSMTRAILSFAIISICGSANILKLALCLSLKEIIAH